MPRERRKLDVLCSKCKCHGYGYLKKHVKKRKFIRTETFYDRKDEVLVKSVYNIPHGINDRRAISGLPPLSEKELAKIEHLNKETIENMIDISWHFHTIVVIFPLIANKYPHLFSIPEVLPALRVFRKLFKPSIDLRHKAGNWDTWFNIGKLVETQSINYASKKTGVSIKQIRNKIPETLEFAKDVINYIPGFVRLMGEIRNTLETDPELLDMYDREFSRAKSQQMNLEPAKKPPGTKEYEYWYIRHPVTSTTRAYDCGPFTESEINEIRKRNLA